LLFANHEKKGNYRIHISVYLSMRVCNWLIHSTQKETSES